MTDKGRTAPEEPEMDDDEAPDAEQTLLEALDALYELADEDPDEALEMFASFPPEIRENREFRIARAAIEKSAGEVERAISTLKALLQEDETDPDVHHMLADALEDAGDEEAATRHFLRTWELDAEHLVDIGEPLRASIVEAARQTIAELPDDFRRRLSDVPVTLADRPTRHEVKEGLDPRSLGMFEGTPLGDGDDEPLPPRRIVLFGQNLAAEFEGDELLEQVAVTILHEIGHYFGLEEDDLERLGLD